MKKFRGQLIVAEWTHPVTHETFVHAVFHDEPPVEWLPYKGQGLKEERLWPHVGGVALIYDEAA